MYKVNATIVGVAPLLQHAFSQTALTGLQAQTSKRTGKADYSLEWMDTMYVRPDGLLGQPAMHIEGAMVKAAASFKMSGKKTFKDAVRSYVYVAPDMIPHVRNGEYVKAPDESLLECPTDDLSVSVMRVVVQRSAVARSRLQIAAGWQLGFEIQVLDEQFPISVLQDILKEAGNTGIGDFRPRYGRFEVVSFERL